MATVTRPDKSLPNPGDLMDAEPIRDYINNLVSFLESTNIDENNVDLTSTDGIVGKSTAQTLTGLKKFLSNSDSAGVLQVVAYGRAPATATQLDNDGAYFSFQGYNDNTTPEAIDYARIKATFLDVSDGSEDGQLSFEVMKAGTITEVFNVGIEGGVLVWKLGNLRIWEDTTNSLMRIKFSAVTSLTDGTAVLTG